MFMAYYVYLTFSNNLYSFTTLALLDKHTHIMTLIIL